MPKIKSHRGASKRFSTTGTGKIKRKKANLRHILTTKENKNKRNARKAGLVASVDEKRVKRLIPYS